MNSPAEEFVLGDLVHRPAAFLLSEKLNGTVVDLSHDPHRHTAHAIVMWADGEVSTEPLTDIRKGACQAVQLPLMQRLSAWLQGLRRSPAAH